MLSKIITPAEAVAVIQDGDALCTSGFVGIGVPEELLRALEKRFIETGQPRGLALMFAAGQGDGRESGLNALGHDGLLKRAWWLRRQRASRFPPSPKPRPRTNRTLSRSEARPREHTRIANAASATYCF